MLRITYILKTNSISMRNDDNEMTSKGDEETSTYIFLPSFLIEWDFVIH